MNKTACSALAAAVFLLVSIPLVAHHGAASFDNEKTLTLKGTVAEWIWANPHCFLKVDVKDDSGTRLWNLELGNPTDITPLGYRRTMFKAGDQVTVTITPVKSGAPVGRLRSVVLPDGQTLPRQ